MKTYVVVGLGRFGQSIACRLCELGNEVLALDKNPEYVQQISNFVTQAVVADAQDSDVLRALGIRNYDCAIVAIGKDLSASVLATLNFKEMGIPLVVCKAHDENHRKVLEKIGADKVRELLTDTCGVTGENADEILRFIACPGTSADKLAFLEQYRGRNETFDTGLDELRTVVGYLPAFGVPEENFELDLTIARGLDYYTGTVYETVLLDHPEVGSICSGGRYDDLAGYYTNKSLPGVGISIGLTRLFYILQEQNMISDAVLTAPADVLILPMTDDLSAAVALASELRAGGLRVQIYSEKKKFKAKIGYADKLGIPFVIFLGEDEVAQHVCALKNMATGVQEAVTSAAALETIRAEIARRSVGAILREP